MAGAASALYLLDVKGRVLIWRDFRGDVSVIEAERFFTNLVLKEVPFPCLHLQIVCCIWFYNQHFPWWTFGVISPLVSLLVWPFWFLTLFAYMILTISYNLYHIGFTTVVVDIVDWKSDNHYEIFYCIKIRWMTKKNWLFFFFFGEKEDVISQGPVIHEKGVTYMFVQHSNLYLMVSSRQNCNAASLLLFLHRLVQVIKLVMFF